MASLLPFFLPSNRGFHPQMSHCLLSAAVDYKIEKDMHCVDIVGSSSILRKIGKCLPDNQLPSRTSEEIKEELLRIYERWERISNLKKFEAALRDTQIYYDKSVVRFEPLEYMFWAEVKVSLSIFS